MDKLTAFKILDCEPTSDMREIKKHTLEKLEKFILKMILLVFK